MDYNLPKIPDLPELPSLEKLVELSNEDSFSKIESGEVSKESHEHGDCVICGTANSELVINPYDEDIHGVRVLEYICSDCYNSLCQDI